MKGQTNSQVRRTKSVVPDGPNLWEALLRAGGSVTRTSTPAQEKAHEVKTAKARKRREKRKVHNKHQKKMNPQHGRRGGQKR